MNTLIVNGENDLLCDLYSSKYNVIKVGTNKEFTYTAINAVSNENNVTFNIKENGIVYDKLVYVPLPGRHSILNSLLAIACARLIGLSLDEIVAGITKIDSTSRRLEIIRTEKFTIIDDCYNASPDSMQAAINVMANMNGTKKLQYLDL